MRFFIKAIYIYFLYVFNKVKRFFRFCDDKDVRVFILHDLNDFEISRLEKLIIRLSDTWDFISPKDFIDYRLGQFVPKRRSILFTFDDGFLSSKKAAEKVLIPRGIDSLFFISPGFIDTANNDESSKYYLNDALKIKVSNVPPALKPMNWSQVRELQSSGQMIGSHTTNHKAISECLCEELVYELENSKVRLESELTEFEVTEFAFPFGHAKSINKTSFDEALKFYDNVYSGFRGGNKGVKHAGLIMRDAINLRDPMFFIDVYLDGMLDYKYKSTIDKLIRINEV